MPAGAYGAAAIALVLLAASGLHVWRVSQAKQREDEAYKKVLLLWDSGDAEAEEGNFVLARKFYQRALEHAKKSRLKIPRIEAAIADAMNRIKTRASEQGLKEASGAVDKLKREGYVVSGAVGVKAGRAARGLYRGKECIDIWVSVHNAGPDPVKVFPFMFAVEFRNGQSCRVEEPNEPFHLSPRVLRSGEGTSGVVVVLARPDKGMNPEDAVAVVFDDRIHVPIKRK